MIDHASANFRPLVSREHAGNAVGDALRLFVGRGRRYSVKQLANATGIKDRVIECAMTDAGSIDYRPLPLEALFSIAKFLGSNFTSEWLGLSDQGAFDLPDGGEPDPGTVAVDTSDDSAVIVRAAMDGSFDNVERPELREVGRRMVTRGLALAALEKAA